MTVNAWVLIAAGVLVTIGPKAVGPFVFAQRPLPEAVRRALRIMPPVLVTALVVAAFWGTDGHGAVPRTLGVLVGSAVFLRFGRLFPAIIVAAVIAAGLRALT